MLMNNYFILSTFVGSIKRLFKIQGYTNPKKETSMTNKRGRYSQEFKLEAIKLVEDQGRKIPEVANSLGIGKTTLENWVYKYRKEQQGVMPSEGKALTPELRRIQELEKQIKQLKMERDILKKASALLAQDNLSVYR
ncbi:transposase [Psychrobacter sp. YGAH215]|nr:transposase [Psychrobacter sp. YGAH215]